MAYREEPNILAIHLADINNSLMNNPSTDNDNELIKRIKMGDAKALDILIQSKMYLVINIAKGFIKRGIDFVDLIQEGYLGLTQAINNFDITKGTMFTTYASRYIIGYIKKYINTNSRKLSIYDDVMRDIAALKKQIESFKEEKGYTPSFDELSEMMHITKNRTMGIYNCFDDTLSLNEKTPSQDGLEINDEIIQTICNDYNLEDDYNKIELNNFLKKIIYNGTLSNREKEIVTYYFGFKNGIPMREKDIALLLGVSRQCVCSIFKSALKKIKNEIMSSKEFYPDYIDTDYLRTH